METVQCLAGVMSPSFHCFERLSICVLHTSSKAQTNSCARDGCNSIGWISEFQVFNRQRRFLSIESKTENSVTRKSGITLSLSKNRSDSDIRPSLSPIRRGKQHFSSAGLSTDRDKVNDDIRTVSLLHFVPCGIETTGRSQYKIVFAPFNSTTNRPFGY